MGQILKKAFTDKWTIIFGLITVLFFIAGFLCPPLAVVDSSVLMVGGEIWAFVFLHNITVIIYRTIELGGHTAFKYKDAEVKVEVQKKEEM